MNIYEFVKRLCEYRRNPEQVYLLSEALLNGSEETDLLRQVLEFNKAKYQRYLRENIFDESVFNEARIQIEHGTFVFKELKRRFEEPCFPTKENAIEQYALKAVKYCDNLPYSFEKEVFKRAGAKLKTAAEIQKNINSLFNPAVDDISSEALKIASEQIIDALVWEITISNQNPLNPNRDPDFDENRLKAKAATKNLACMFAEAYKVSSDRELFMQRYSETFRDLKALCAKNSLVFLNKPSEVIDKVSQSVQKTVENSTKFALSITQKGIAAFEKIYKNISEVYANNIETVDYTIQDTQKNLNGFFKATEQHIVRAKEFVKTNTAFTKNDAMQFVSSISNELDKMPITDKTMQSIKDRIIANKARSSPLKGIVQAVCSGTESIIKSFETLSKAIKNKENKKIHNKAAQITYGNY